MTRCLSCNSLLTPGETVCGDCGTPLVVEKARLPVLLSRAASIVFYMSLGMLIASFFIPLGPGFMKGLLLTVAMLFLKRSAQDWADKSAAH